MNKDILVFGVNGRLGQVIVKNLNTKYQITGVDIQDKSLSICKNYHKISSLQDLHSIYDKKNFYSVIHCQQIKPAGFTQTNFLDLEIDEYDKIMDTNLKLSFLSSQCYLKACLSNKGEIKGRIINFVSTYSIISSNPTLYDGTEMGNPVHYTISKAGLWGLTKYIAANIREYGVLCNSIAPHGIENNQGKEFKVNFSKRNPMGRLSNPSEVIPAIEFLLDEKNTYVNGSNIPVDGGWTAC